ncbi:alpha/beta-hydrolase [Lentinus tigrinus ALCF2SS1-6]|uniref:Alpha/beta-hydrolase n=1 Tax=Lentinus tigrinus ALCF2SS1-6 TaxID=1328759 RepID=A0A5C2RYW8_9APHY|nr:alpha/beta-hydrolase [Lentinus tigrinus ALCF2SS1-6]
MTNPTATEEPFKLAIPQADLDLLRQKLRLVRFPDELDGAGWDYGVPLGDVKRLAAHWKDMFDWRKAEAKINELLMFTRDIEVEGFGTLDVHYVHQKSEVKNAIPLLFVHGWPGDFLEVRKVLSLLTGKSPDHPSFHVVAPSLPGFGFSSAINKPGFKGPQYAELLNKLMVSLGYNEYVYQGGDWGHWLGLHAVTHYGHKHIKAWHSNMPLTGAPPSSLKNPLIFLSKFLLPFRKTDARNLKAAQMINKQGSAYNILQSTKPQTLAAAGLDIREARGLVGQLPLTDDEVIEWVSIYWFSKAGPGAAGRIYYEMSSGGTGTAFDGCVWQNVPLGISYFPGEVVHPPRSWSHMLGKIVFQGEHEKGGHFAAHEVPDALAGDLRKMYGKGGPAYGVVPGRDGYTT